MKREVANYVAECDVCRRVKAEHQKPTGDGQYLPDDDFEDVDMDTEEFWP